MQRKRDSTMSFWKVFLVFPIGYILTVFSKQTTAILISKPRNTVSLRGNRIELKCRRAIDDASQQQLIDWDFSSTDIIDAKQFYFNGKFFGNFSSRYKIIRNESGQFDLEIDHAELSHAGNYRCSKRRKQKTLPNNDNNSASAELVVLDSDPICSASVLNETEEYAVNNIQCSVDYNGNAKPKADCSLIKDGVFSSNAVQINFTRTPNSHNISRDTMETAVNISKLQNITFVCNITFISTGHTGLDDKFEYLYTWTHLFIGNISTSDNKKSSLPFAIVGIVIGLSVILCVLTISLCLLCISQRKGANNHRVEPDILAEPSQVDANLHYEDIDIRDQPRHLHIMAEESRHEDFLPHRNGRVPVYAQVKKEPNAYVSHKTMAIPNAQLSVDAHWSKAPRPNETTTGADGTVYMEINSHSDRSQFMPSATNHRPLFSKVETYALIDHNSRRPPPPPPPSF